MDEGKTRVKTKGKAESEKSRWCWKGGNIEEEEEDAADLAFRKCLYIE